MIIFIFVSVYLMPILGFLFILSLLRAIKKIIKDKPYSVELFWSGTFFGLIVWTICMIILSVDK